MSAQRVFLLRLAPPLAGTVSQSIMWAHSGTIPKIFKKQKQPTQQPMKTLVYAVDQCEPDPDSMDWLPIPTLGPPPWGREVYGKTI